MKKITAVLFALTMFCSASYACDLEVADYDVDESGGTYTFKGTVENKGDAATRFVIVNIRLVDNDGKLICLLKTPSDPLTLDKGGEGGFEISYSSEREVDLDSLVFSFDCTD